MRPDRLYLVLGFLAVGIVFFNLGIFFKSCNNLKYVNIQKNCNTLTDEYVNPTKLELLIKDVIGDDRCEVFVRYDGGDLLLFKLRNNTPVIQGYKLIEVSATPSVMPSPQISAPSNARPPRG